MRKRCPIQMIPWIIMLIMLLSAVYVAAEEAEKGIRLTKSDAALIAIDLDAFISETQQTSKKADEMVLVWWIPEEFWKAALLQDRSVKPTDVTALSDLIHPYTLVAVVDGTVGHMAGITYRPGAETIAAIHVKDATGKLYAPLDEKNINPDISNLLAVFKPIMANMIGPMGKNMHFLAFENKDKAGARIFDPRKEGAFIVTLRDTEFRWKLPLASLTLPVACPKCGERLNGTYKFCPWDGTKLSGGDQDAGAAKDSQQIDGLPIASVITGDKDADAAIWLAQAARSNTWGPCVNGWAMTKTNLEVVQTIFKENVSEQDKQAKVIGWGATKVAAKTYLVNYTYRLSDGSVAGWYWEVNVEKGSVATVHGNYDLMQHYHLALSTISKRKLIQAITKCLKQNSIEVPKLAGDTDRDLAKLEEIEADVCSDYELNCMSNCGIKSVSRPAQAK